jgi:hypothetical protein
MPESDDENKVTQPAAEEIAEPEVLAHSEDEELSPCSCNGINLPD